MKRVILIIVVVLAGLVWPANAQEGETTLKCSDQDTSAALQTAADLIAGAQGQDVTAQYAAIVDARSALAAVDSACLGLDFQGSGMTVSDPVFVPAGIYRVTVTTADSFVMDATVLDGECEASSIMGLFTILGEDAANGAQAVFKSEGCLTLWEISLSPVRPSR